MQYLYHLVCSTCPLVTSGTSPKAGLRKSQQRKMEVVYVHQFVTQLLTAVLAPVPQ